jgi:hypothetical protein
VCPLSPIVSTVPCANSRFLAVFNSGFSESTIPAASIWRSRSRPSIFSGLDDDGELSLDDDHSETNSASEGDEGWDEDDDSPVDESEDEEEDEDEPEEEHFQDLSPGSPNATSSLNSSTSTAFPAQAPVSPDVSRSSRRSNTPLTSTTPRSRTSSASLTDDETQSFQPQSTASSHHDEPPKSESGRQTPPSSNRFVDAASAPSSPAKVVATANRRASASIRAPAGKGRQEKRGDGRAKFEVVVTDARCVVVVSFPPRQNELN